MNYYIGIVDLATDPLWIIAIEGTWALIDAFIYFIVKYYFNIELQTPERRMIAVLTELKTVLSLVDPEWYNQKKEEIFKT